ncbi:MAG: glycosidase, partial [Deltaproteobacteria bacterium]
DLAPRLSEFANYETVVGIPFIDEQDVLADLLQSVDRVMASWIGRRQVIVCVGDHSAVKCLEIIEQQQLKHQVIAFLLPEEISGRGNSIRAMIEIGKKLEADLLIFNANMANEQGPGIEPVWLDSLLSPIQGRYDMVLGSLRRYLSIDSITYMLATPILEAFYGCRVSDPLGGIYALSHDLVDELAHEMRFWGGTIQGSGIDFWLLTRALAWDKKICEVNMGGVVPRHSLESRNRIFRDTALTIFECLKRDSAIWIQERLVIKVADIGARSEVKKADIIDYPVPQLLSNFTEGCQAYDYLFNQEEAQRDITYLVNLSQQKFRLCDQFWVSSLFELFLAYAFAAEDEDTSDIFSALTALYNGRIASYVLEMRSLGEKLGQARDEEKDELMVHKMESIRQHLTSQCWQMKPHLTERWLQKSDQQKPAIVPLGYMEYVPGKPVVVPKKIAGKDQRIVATDDIFKSLRKKYEERFSSFMEQGLGIPLSASPAEMVAGVESFMADLEMALDKLLPGDLSTRDGLQNFVRSTFALFAPHHMFTISTELLREMLMRFPPVNLMIPLGIYKPEDLISRMDPRDAVTYSNLVESWNYTDRDLLWLVDNLKPESFNWIDIKPIILTGDLRMGIMTQGKISNLNRITGRILVRSCEPGKGGKFPKLRYFTSLVRRLAVADSYSRLFKLNISQRKNIGLKARNSLMGLQRGDDFSAFSLFENLHHRRLAEKISILAENLDKKGMKDIARLFRLMVEGYGLTQVLENGTFLTCTAWSWASYSFKGGLKIPTPLTTSVENRWFNHDFLEMLYLELGYDPSDIEKMVMQLIQSGKSHHILLDTLLPARPRDVDVVVQEITNEPSRHLQRCEHNPILEPLEGSTWESRYVLNPGSLRIKDKVYLFYRAVGKDDVSRIGLAITDGYKVLERLPQPIFSPETPEEKRGCEDPRLIVIEDKIFMIYTAYDGNLAQIAAASMKLNDFLAGRYTAWHREGLAFRNIWDKDAILFPEKINGQYVIYHRIEPSIWVTYLKDLKFPIKEKHAIIAGPRPGRMWDSLKIGAGAQPIKTIYGWLLIYHGVDYNYFYRLGVLLVDLNNPQKVLYRSPNPILEPEEDFEIGLSGSWVPNVVFTCGAVAGTDKEVLEDNDEILVYYGAADTSIGVAKATLADLIPPAFRKSK